VPQHEMVIVAIYLRNLFTLLHCCCHLAMQRQPMHTPFCLKRQPVDCKLFHQISLLFILLLPLLYCCYLTEETLILLLHHCTAMLLLPAQFLCRNITVTTPWTLTAVVTAPWPWFHLAIVVLGTWCYVISDVAAWSCSCHCCCCCHCHHHIHHH